MINNPYEGMSHQEMVEYLTIITDDLYSMAFCINLIKRELGSRINSGD